MSYKVIIRHSYVTVSDGIGDIIGPSHKKIKVVSDCLSIYAYWVDYVFCGAEHPL